MPSISPEIRAALERRNQGGQMPALNQISPSAPGGAPPLNPVNSQTPSAIPQEVSAGRRQGPVEDDERMIITKALINRQKALSKQDTPQPMGGR